MTVSYDDEVDAAYLKLGGETPGDEVRDILRETIELIMEDDRPPELGVGFAGTQQIVVA